MCVYIIIFMDYLNFYLYISNEEILSNIIQVLLVVSSDDESSRFLSGLNERL